ncbi:MAG TPA: hypothetical protein EYQ82_03845 [Dehalococcoidia bacterium]|nr:hypothetical protein [Dehalococcoidia bacterium]
MGHLRENGFDVTIIEVPDVAVVQAQLGVPSEFRGCHTAQVGKYIVEGHVPADLIMRFLEEDAGLAGITVPGMVMGPPGMEGPEPTPYSVLTFDRDGTSALYESR